MLIPMPASRDEWLTLRGKYVGASDVAALFGVQAGYSLDRFALHHVKAGNVPAPEVGGARVKWGQRLEELVALALNEDHGYAITRGRYAIADDCPGLGASLDFETEGDPLGEFSGPGIVETKNVDFITHKRAWTDGEPPPHILLQLQAQLGASGYGWGLVAALVGGNDLRVYRYAARPKLIADIKARVEQFWQDVSDGREPKPSASDASAAIIRAMYAETRGDLVDLSADNELPALCAQMLEAAERRRAAEKDEAEAKNRIAAKAGPNLRIMAQGYWINVAVVAEKPDRPAEAGEIIRGRKESRRITVKPQEQAA